MPTGYTQFVQNGKITELRDFALLCARQFGACMEMRDAPLDAPLPERFEPSPYYRAEIEKAQAELARLQSLAPTELSFEAQAAFMKAKEQYERNVASRQQETARYEAMLEKVSAWNPPTSEHANLKSFMLEQLEISIDRFPPGKGPNPADYEPNMWLFGRIAELESDILFARKEYQKEVERIERSNKWLAELRASLEADTVTV